MAKQKEDNSRDIVTLDYKDHVIQRIGMYAGSNVLTELDSWILTDDDKIEFKKVSYTPSAYKLICEVLDNALDEGTKTNWEFSTKINVTLTNDFCSVEDNGRGIPVKKNADGEWMPKVAFCNGMSGSNFNDSDRTSIGQNGTGAKISNFLSKNFEVVTCDGKGKLKVTCKDNASTIKVTELTPTPRTGTKVSFNPDFEKLNSKDFGDVIPQLLKTRLKFLSWCYPKCTFTFNGEKVSMKVKDLAAMFSDNTVFINNENAFIGVYPSDEPYVFTYLNGLTLKGGTHVDYVTNKIVTDIREKVSKKFKNIKPTDIKNRISIIVLLKGFPKCSFDSQVKEVLTNSVSEVGEFFRTNGVDLDALSNKVLKEKEILDNITDIFKAKEDIAEKKALEKLGKVRKEVDSEKYYPPVGKTQKKYLMITEGFSAFSGISPILGRKDIGYYMLKGKPANILDEKAATFMANQEIRELVQILGIDLSDPETDMNYEKVVILSDADADGTAIAGLVITMFSKIAPRMLREGRICRMETPLLIGLDTKDNVKEYYFSFPEKSAMKKDLKYFYLKGLGSWVKSRFNQVMEMEGGMDKLIKPYLVDDKATETIQNWFGKDSEPRKKAIRGREFHIDNA